MTRRLRLILAGLSAAALIGAVLWAVPIVALLAWMGFDSLMPQTIRWQAKNAYAKCESAIAGIVAWPDNSALACAAMQMCANEAMLSSQQYDQLVATMRSVPGCGEP